MLEQITDEKIAKGGSITKTQTEIEKGGRPEPPEIIRSEVNFLVFPFFALCRQDVHKRTETEYKTIQRRGDEEQEIVWSVSANPKYGYPGPFDRRLHKAVEELLGELKAVQNPIQNPICLGSLYSMAKRMGVTPSGTIRKQIRLALQRITATVIVSKRAFYSKERKRHLEGTFHLYDCAVYIGEELPGGETADANYLFLGSWYLGSVNANDVKPTDFTFWKSLKGEFASRLYDILGVKFYGLKGGECIRYRYSTLCQLLPAVKQKYFSDAKARLNPAHEELKSKGFLADYRWSQGKGNDWYILYWPGWKAREEIKGSTFAFKQLPPAEGLPEGKPADEEAQLELIPASPNPELNEVWQGVIGDLEQELSQKNFDTWVKGSALLALEENKAVVGVHHHYIRKYLETHLRSRITKSVMNSLGREIALEFVVIAPRSVAEAGTRDAES